MLSIAIKARELLMNESELVAESVVKASNWNVDAEPDDSLRVDRGAR